MTSQVDIASLLLMLITGELILNERLPDWIFMNLEVLLSYILLWYHSLGGIITSEAL